MRVMFLALLLSPLPALAQDCGTPRACYNTGFSDGVAAVNAQLGAVTAQMQRDVQAQVNAQLARLDAERTRELEARLATAQDQALAAQGPAQAVGDGPSVTMPTLPPRARAPGGGIAPVLPRDLAAAPRSGSGPIRASPPIRRLCPRGPRSPSPIPRTCRPSCSGR